MKCCVTGHRPAGFLFPRDEDDPRYRDYLEKLQEEVRKLVEMGCDTFFTGMAEGADIDFAVAVLLQKRETPNIRLEAAIPYPVRPTREKTTYHVNRDAILEACDVVHTVSDHYFRGCMDKRNRFMVDRSDLIFAIWNGKESGGTWNTIKYARTREKNIRYLMLAEICGEENP